MIVISQENRDSNVTASSSTGSTPLWSAGYINPNFDSALKARFIESLKKLGGIGEIPTVKLVQDADSNDAVQAY